MKLPKVQTGIERGNITSYMRTSYAIMPSWSISGAFGDAWGWVKKNRCQIGCGAAQAAAMAGCSVTGFAGPALLACEIAAGKGGELCRNRC